MDVSNVVLIISFPLIQGKVFRIDNFISVEMVRHVWNLSIVPRAQVSELGYFNARHSVIISACKDNLPVTNYRLLSKRL